MPMYDRQCNDCGQVFKDRLEKMNDTPMLKCECGGDAPRIISCHAVTGDDIPGGISIEHGVCNPDGSPKTYYTKSSIYKAAKAKGLHVGAFMHGSPSGRRWI